MLYPISLPYFTASSMFLNMSDNKDLSKPKPYAFHKLSPPEYTLATLSDKPSVSFKNILSKLFKLPFLISATTALNSLTTSFSSQTPYLINFSS